MFHRAVIHVLEAVNVFLAAKTLLYFMDDTFRATQIGHTMNTANRNADILAWFQRQSVSVQNDGQDSLRNHPMLPAMVVGLQGQRLSRVHSDVLFAELLAVAMSADGRDDITTPSSGILIPYLITSHVVDAAHGFCAFLELFDHDGSRFIRGSMGGLKGGMD